MLVYRVCTKEEALAQVKGEQYSIPTSQQVLKSANPGFHVTMVPEFWRRVLNGHFNNNGLGMRDDYTLLLDIPDDT